MERYKRKFKEDKNKVQEAYVNSSLKQWVYGIAKSKLTGDLVSKDGKIDKKVVEDIGTAIGDSITGAIFQMGWREVWKRFWRSL